MMTLIKIKNTKNRGIKKQYFLNSLELESNF